MTSTMIRHKQLLEVIKARLKNSKWPDSLNNFIDLDAFWSLITATGGHARQSLAVLKAAMEYIQINKKPKKIGIECIKEGIDGIIRSDKGIDEKDFAIVQFLLDSGPHSASDKDFQHHLGLTQRPLID